MGGRGKHGGPHTLKCPRCVKGEYYRRGDRPSADGITATGASRGPLWRHGRLVTLFEVRHARCGHVWWTKHRDAERRLRAGPNDADRALTAAFDRQGTRTISTSPDSSTKSRT
jgi:hypothetical protein